VAVVVYRVFHTVQGEACPFFVAVLGVRRLVARTATCLVFNELDLAMVVDGGAIETNIPLVDDGVFVSGGRLWHNCYSGLGT
jgi:hypothetical protein